MLKRIAVLFAFVVLVLLSAAPAAHAQYTYMPNVMLDWQTEAMDFVAQARENMHNYNDYAAASIYGRYNGGGYGYSGGYSGYGNYAPNYGSYAPGYGGYGYSMPQYRSGYQGYYGQGYGRGYGYGQNYGQRGGYRPFVPGRSGRGRHSVATQDTVNAWGIANTIVGAGNLALGFANRSKLNKIERKLDERDSYRARIEDSERDPQEPQPGPEMGAGRPMDPSSSPSPRKTVEIWTNRTGCDVLVKDWDDTGWRVVRDGEKVRVEYGPQAECRVNRAGYSCSWQQTAQGVKNISAQRTR